VGHNQIGREREFEDVLLGHALVRVTTCCDTDLWVFGYVGYEVAIAEGVRAETGKTGGLKRRRWVGNLGEGGGRVSIGCEVSMSDGLSAS
jgi:hypothetical protein